MVRLIEIVWVQIWLILICRSSWLKDVRRSNNINNQKPTSIYRHQRMKGVIEKKWSISFTPVDLLSTTM
jgi:hypothetical protein